MKRSSRVSVLSVLSHRAYKIESLVLCHLSVHIFILDADNRKAGADLITSSFFALNSHVLYVCGSETMSVTMLV